MNDPKSAAIAAWQAFGSRDPERIRAALAGDATWIAPPDNATAVALGTTVEDVLTVDGIVEFMTAHFRKLFPEGAQFDFSKVVAEGDTVVFEQRMRARTVNGREYDNLYCWIFEMQDGRVRVMREYMDTHKGYRMIFGDEAVRKIVP